MADSEKIGPDYFQSLCEKRRSIRGFRPDAVPKQDLERLFAMAQEAPSWCNIQPWRLAMTSPPLTQELSRQLVEAAKRELPSPDLEFPLVYPEPYGQHRRHCGGTLYGAMGVERGDKSGRYDAWLRNYELFDAPHLVVLSRDKRLGEYATLDLGVWLGIFLLAAESLGIDACPMASVAAYPKVLRQVLDIPEEEMILCGVAFGYRDEEVAANKAKPQREVVSANLRHVTGLKAL